MYPTGPIYWTKVISKAMVIQKKYKKLKIQFKKTKADLVKEVEDRAKFIEQIKGYVEQIKSQKEIIDRFNRDPSNTNGSPTDELKMNELNQQVSTLKAKVEELNKKNEKCLREKKNLETEITEVQQKCLKLTEANEVLLSNLSASCTEYRVAKTTIEEKIQEKLNLEYEIEQLKNNLAVAEKRISQVEEESKTNKNEKEIYYKKVEDLKNKIVSPDDYAYIFIVNKESVFGKEDLLVN